MFVEGERCRRFHLQQPINLLERRGMTIRENIIDNGPGKPSAFNP